MLEAPERRGVPDLWPSPPERWSAARPLRFPWAAEVTVLPAAVRKIGERGAQRTKSATASAPQARQAAPIGWRPVSEEAALHRCGPSGPPASERTVAHSHPSPVQVSSLPVSRCGPLSPSLLSLSSFLPVAAPRRPPCFATGSFPRSSTRSQFPRIRRTLPLRLPSASQLAFVPRGASDPFIPVVRRLEPILHLRLRPLRRPQQRSPPPATPRVVQETAARSSGRPSQRSSCPLAVGRTVACVACPLASAAVPQAGR